MSRQLSNDVNELESIYLTYLNQSKNLTHQQFNAKPGQDQWSVGQVLFHIWSSSDFTQSFMQKRMAEKKVTQSTSLKTALRNMLLQVALASRIKFKAPRAVSAIPEEIFFDELDSSFKKNIAAFKTMMENFPAELENKEIFKHPRIGYINAGQTLSFLKAHALHHKPQLENLLKSI